MDPTENGAVLLIEDHRDIAEMVYAYLERRGYEVDYAADGVTGLHLAVTNSYDVIVLDLMLPGMDGLDVCRRVREDAKRDTPIVMLTARDTLEDKIAGLESGADDYLVKPFEIQELEARVRACLRRHRGLMSPEMLTVGDLTLDTGILTVRRAGKEISVTPIGMKILSVLMRAAPRVVSRRELERQVWGDVLPDSDALRSHLYNLRKAVDRPFEHALIHTVQTAGYRMAPPDGD
jgi:DNA-binding response OmpR family regulator